MNQIIRLLQGENHTWLNGNNGRLYWQDGLDGFTGEVTDANRSIVCAGWHVITWKGKKAVTRYFGQSFDDALDMFEKENK